MWARLCRFANPRTALAAGLQSHTVVLAQISPTILEIVLGWTCDREKMSTFGMMNVNDPKIASLRAEVKAAQQEFDMAVKFHEVWKLAVYDEDLHRRMGVSRATNAFHVVRVALRREMWLALMRLWDKVPKAVRMENITKTLRDKRVIDALAADRAARMPVASGQIVVGQIRQSADKAIALASKYSKGGSQYAVREKLQRLRHERLAHRQIQLAAVTGADATDGEIESFYQDISELIRLLISIVEGDADNPQQTAQVYRDYATFFWAGMRGEQTEGHPDYRAPLPPRQQRENGGPAQEP
jgi:AbiU2